MPSTAPATSDERRLRIFRIRVFVATWICYAGLYFCRHAFYIAKGSLTEQRGFDAETLGFIGVVYLIAYSLGEFNAAAVGSKIGARRVLLAGMALSIVANLGFGVAEGTRTFMVFMALNGLAQATGWSGNVGTMAHWFRRRERGQVMGIWSTCYQLGAVLAKGFASFMLRWSLRASFWGASAVLSVVWGVFFVLQRNRPEDVGLAPIDDEDDEGEGKGKGKGGHEAATGAATPPRPGFTRGLLVTVLMMGCFYFFVKSIRYALWSWAPYFLQLNFGLEKETAGYYSAIFDICGFLGVMVAGFLSDRLFAGRRAVLAFLLIAGLLLSTMLLWLAGSRTLLMFGVSIGLIGFTLYGPDSLITGAGAIDVGSRRYAIAAAGIINGMGSLGPVLQEIVIGQMYKKDPTALAPILGLLTLSASVATVIMGLLVLRARQGKCNL
jgi:MFS transporter, OPA family, glycerol-3-phosphate transporter